jgi:hypothetical protein
MGRIAVLPQFKFRLRVRVIFQVTLQIHKNIGCGFLQQVNMLTLQLETTEFGLNQTHIHSIELFSGSCTNLNLLADDELAFVSDARVLRVDLNASNLVTGQDYFIKVNRTSLVSGRTCDKSVCTQNNSTAPTTFDICIEEINLIIPPDFSGEEPTPENAFFVNKGQLRKTDGQIADEIMLYTRNAVPNTYISEDKLAYVFSTVDTANQLDLTHRIDMSLVNAASRPIFKTEELDVMSNFYNGHVERGIVRNRSYSRTVSNNVYDKIDFHSYSNSTGIKHYFVINIGGDPDDIQMGFDGADSIEVTTSGGLMIYSTLGILEFNPPIAYMVNPAGNIVPMPWQAEFYTVAANAVKLDIREYSPNMPLFVQIEQNPTPKIGSTVEWGTFFGGGNDDYGYDITHDNDGNIFVTGVTYSNDFPQIGQGSFQQGFGGGSDAFIAKFNELYQREWVTYLGGSPDEIGVAIAYSEVGDYVYTATDAFLIYPNPTTDMIHINLSENKAMLGGKIVCYDTSGKHVRTWLIENEETVLQVSDLSAGTYLLTLQSDTAVYKTKFMKQ